MLFTILLWLLAEVPTSYATLSSNRHGVLNAKNLRAFHAHAKREVLQEQHMKLVSRQSSPPITNDPDCSVYDGYFYTTPANYTWQLQCANSYDGTVLAQTTDTTDLGACIAECVNYNRAHTPGACIAVTFSGSYSVADTVCTQFSSVDLVSIASEEGGVVNSALLILGPDGEIFATPSPEPTFSGAPTQPPGIDPVPSQLTTSAMIMITSAPLSVTNLASVVTSYTALTVTTTSTSTIMITSCLAGQPCEPTNTLTEMPSGFGTPGGTASQSTSTLSISISDGGSRPVSTLATTTGAGVLPRSTTSGAAAVVAGQRTFTTIVPFTEFRVQVIEICAATPTPCSQSLRTATNVVHKTEISCVPGACSGVVPSAGYLVDAILAATCVVAA